MSQTARKCQVCRVTFMASRSDARYCTGRCRTRAYRARMDVTAIDDEIDQAEQVARRARSGRRKNERAGG